jgi:hypothetical protein
MALAQILYAQRKFKIKQWKWVFSAMLSWMLTASFALLVKQSSLGQPSQLIILIICSLTVFFLLVISPKQLLKE